MKWPELIRGHEGVRVGENLDPVWHHMLYLQKDNEELFWCRIRLEPDSSLLNVWAADMLTWDVTWMTSPLERGMTFLVMATGMQSLKHFPSFNIHSAQPPSAPWLYRVVSLSSATILNLKVISWSCVEAIEHDTEENDNCFLSKNNLG